ncbi:MAG: hypothetical protein AAF253_06555 [Pseudomonadota bacterium]
MSERRRPLTVAAHASPERMAALADISAGAIRPIDPKSGGDSAVLVGDIIILEKGVPGTDDLLEAYLRERPEVGMLLVGDDLNAVSIRRLAQFWAFDVAPADVAMAELLEAAAGLARFVLGTRDDQRARDREEGAQFWGFLGCVGGAGTTTLAIETACAVARANQTGRTAIIDLGLQAGMVAQRLDGVASLDIDALIADPQRLDEALLRTYSWSHPAGIELIAAPRNLRLDEASTEDAVLALLDLASSQFDHVILDLPRHRLPWSDSVFGALDELIVVSELTVPSLQLAAEYCRDIDGLREGQAPTRLLLNRMYPKRSNRHNFSVPKAEDAIGRRIDFLVRSDWETARVASDLGEPVVSVRQRSPIVRDVDVLVERLAKTETVGAGYEEAA